MPKVSIATLNDIDQAIEAAMDRVIRDFVHSESIRQQHREFASARGRHVVQGIEAHLATAGSGAPLCGTIQAGLS